MNWYVRQKNVSSVGTQRVSYKRETQRIAVQVEQENTRMRRMTGLFMHEC